MTGRECFLRPEWYGDLGLSIPSLHIWGSSDKVVPGPQSGALANRFLDPEILIHDKGHVPPQDTVAVGRILDFVAGRAAGHR